VKIVATAGEINDRGDWHAFCALKGIGEWAMNEGSLGSSEEFTFSTEEAHKVGLASAIIRDLEDYETAGEVASSCLCMSSLANHSCPYQSEIKANNDEDYCNCCDACTMQCKMSV
jgi:hypothetical protein